MADQRQARVFCYECHEELLHNPILYPDDLSALARLFALRGADESGGKPPGRQKLAKRILVLHEVVSEGIREALMREGGEGPDATS